MTKEIHDINTKAVDFVVELIDYIAEYPDDDYMTMECLCRKLVKHGLMDKVDGRYEPTDEPQTNADQHIQSVESVKDETGHWVRVGQWEWEHHTDTTHFGKTKGESITTNKVEDEPQTEAWKEPFETERSE